MMFRFVSGAADRKGDSSVIVTRNGSLLEARRGIISWGARNRAYIRDPETGAVIGRPHVKTPPRYWYSVAEWVASLTITPESYFVGDCGERCDAFHILREFCGTCYEKHVDQLRTVLGA